MCFQNIILQYLHLMTLYRLRVLMRRLYATRKCQTDKPIIISFQANFINTDRCMIFFSVLFWIYAMKMVNIHKLVSRSYKQNLCKAG